MKRRSVLVCVLALAAVPALAHAAPRGEARAVVAGKSVSIDYGRPSLQGRDMLGRATPGEPWRMGADGPTMLTTEADLSFGTVQVPKGTYILSATKDDKGTWTLNVRDKADRENVVANVPLEAGTVKESVEMFTVELKAEKDKGTFTMTWGTASFSAPFTGK
jgi:Protein of unknown function (DUF2911)